MSRVNFKALWNSLFGSGQRFMSTMNFKTIGTHNGTFHCDEVVGCFLLKLLNKDAEIVRSRDPSLLNECDIVIDVGGVFDPKKLRFDHHQKDFTHTMNSLRPEMPYHIKLSSAGLVYCHFGEEILEKAVGSSLDEQALPQIYKKVYETFFKEIDGIDNGVMICDGEFKYNIHTHLSKRVSHLNKNWNHVGDFDENEAFQRAMNLAGNEFIETVQRIYFNWWPARKEVINSLNKRYELHESGEIMQLEISVPFIEHLLMLEKEMKIEPSIKYVIYADGDNWRIRAIPVSEFSFDLRVPLLEKWKALREQDLVLQGAMEGAIFVHSNGFIGGHRTHEGVLHMAVKSLEAVK